LRASLCLLTLSLGLFCPVSAQSQSVPNSSTLSEVNDLAATLVAAASEEEQERLLARKPDLMNSSLLAALRELASPSIQKRDYAQALRISQLAVRIAERVGDRLGLGNALLGLGSIYRRQKPAAQARECYQNGLNQFQ